jgi:NAD(P)-dependent dehydrogenase (short-subunit alcohol dehydrogenase family)
MESLKGKKCLITGASSGLGLEVTKLFLKADAEVIMLCRDEKKSNKVMNELYQDYPGASIQLEIADFSSLNSLNTFLQSFKKKHSSLDILINNAAILKAEISHTVDGFESMFQVNFLAPVLLTLSLIEHLESGVDSKILNIALPSEKYQLDFNDIQSLEHFKPMDNLLRTKLCLMIFSLELASRIKNTGIKVMSGVPNQRPFRSNLGREMPFFMGLAMNLISVKLEKVAPNIPYMLSLDDVETGFVFQGQKAASVLPYWRDVEVRNRLWKETEKLLETNLN